MVRIQSPPHKQYLAKKWTPDNRHLRHSVYLKKIIIIESVINSRLENVENETKMLLVGKSFLHLYVYFTIATLSISLSFFFFFIILLLSLLYENEKDMHMYKSNYSDNILYIRKDQLSHPHDYLLQRV